MDNKILDMQLAITKLNDATKAYNAGQPYVSDKEWDDLYFKLKNLEKETGVIFPNSPTQKIEYKILDSLNKVKHNHPMLSLDKTKDVKEIKNFVKGKEWLAMFKMDGLTCSLTYKNGKLVGAETRGDGVEGEDILHNALVIPTIPKNIPNKNKVVVDGEIICEIPIFEEYFKNEYKHIRNFASGSIRLLNSKESETRKLTFVAWDLIEGINEDFFCYRLEELDKYGFTVVPCVVDAETVEDAIETLNTDFYRDVYPIDGLVFRYESQELYNKAGKTDHHFRGAMAYKFYDEEYETRLNYIDYDVSRNGILTPVAVFEPIEIDNTIVERASLHNISIMEEVLGDTPYSGQKIWVCKQNQIIPQITKAIKLDYGTIVSHGGVTTGLGGDYGVLCPICGGLTSIATSETGVKILMCDNPKCEGKLAQRIDYYCGKKGLDIKGLSRKTIEKLIDWGWVNGIRDIYKLEQYRTEWESKTGFGKASVSKILNAINAEGRHPKLESFISALGIPLVGSTIAKTLVKEFSTWQEFRDYVDTDDCFFDIFDGIGEEINNSLKNFDYTEADEIAGLLAFKQPESLTKEESATSALKDKILVITGKLSRKRDDIKTDIEKASGKVTGSVSSKTNYLVCNDKNSTTGKSADAKKLGIPVITEEELAQLLNNNAE